MNWDAKKKEEIEDRAAIKVVFNEGLDASTVDVSDFVVENPDVSIESLQVAGADAANADSKNEVVYLKLSDDLASDARPRVELDGSIMDKAGNELKSAAIPRVEDGIKPGVTVDAFSGSYCPTRESRRSPSARMRTLRLRPLRSTSTSARAWRSRAAAASRPPGAL